MHLPNLKLIPSMVCHGMHKLFNQSRGQEPAWSQQSLTKNQSYMKNPFNNTHTKSVVTSLRNLS